MPNYDRRADMMPTQDPMMRYVSSAPPIKRYTYPDNASPMNKLEDLSGDGKITQKDVLIGRGVIDKEGKPLSRKMKFCGGRSTPYKRYKK